MSHKKLRALIIGAGNIASDYDSPESDDVLTHAHGFLSVSDFELVGFFDTNAVKAQSAADKWGGQAFNSVKNAFDSGMIDVVSVATPDHTHATILKELVEFSPRLIFCEKPVAISAAEVENTMSLFANSVTAVQVNYSRRFVPEFRSVKAEIASGKYGRFLTGAGSYVKGLLHNGSHMVDLLRFWCGDVCDVKWIEQHQNAILGDSETTAYLRLNSGGSLTLLSVPGNPYWVFELDLFFEKKRLRVLDSGNIIQEYEPYNCKEYSGTFDLRESIMRKTELRNAMHYAVKNLRDNLLNGDPLICPLVEAAETLTSCIKKP